MFLATLAIPEPVAVEAVPEPATWLTMLLGFGLAGSVVRRRLAPEPRRAARSNG